MIFPKGNMTVPTREAFFLAVDDRTVRLWARVKPGASRDHILGVVDLPAGPTIDIRVSAPAIDGRANDAVIALLAKSWRLPKSDLTIISGTKSRLKNIAITGDASELMPRLRAWVGLLEEE